MKDAICFICENLYDSLEEAEVCERSHEQNQREKHDDDGVEYADPRDYRDGLE
jgi:hypothetical protein